MDANHLRFDKFSHPWGRIVSSAGLQTISAESGWLFTTHYNHPGRVRLSSRFLKGFPGCYSPSYKPINTIKTMSTVTENITPAKAQEYLRTSRGNRPISKVYVRSYADTMKKGGWMLNGVPIIFDTDSHLVDGHHRLLAVIEAGIPVRFDVVRGAPSEAFTTYDTGRHRTVGQILAMQGVKHYNMVGSIVNANEALIRYGRLVANNAIAGEMRRTLSDSYEAYCRDREGYDETAAYICQLQDKCRIITASWAGGLFYFLTHTGGYNEFEVRPFFDCLFDIGSSEIPAAEMLRHAITNNALNGGRKLEIETLWAFIVKSWNAYISGKMPKILKYASKREDLPQLILR